MKYPEFSGIIRYENTVEVKDVKKASLIIEDAFEGVEVFVNDESVGIQATTPFVFDITKELKSGKNKLRIEVATSLERERHFAPQHPNDWRATLEKPVLAPTGIIGEVKLVIQK